MSKPHGLDNSTHTAARRARQTQGANKTLTCPHCGEDYGNLPLHLRACEASPDTVEVRD